MGLSYQLFYFRFKNLEFNCSSSSKVDAGAINTPASLAKNITKVGEAESYTLLKYNTSSPHYDSVYYGYPPIKSNNNN